MFFILCFQANFSDIGSRSLKFFGNIGISAHISVTTLAGNGYHGNEDGLGYDSSFAQPTGICHEGNTIIAADSGANTIRIITNTVPLVKYLQNLQNLFKAFSVHEVILGDGHSDDIKHSISTLKEVEISFQDMTGQAKTHLNLNITDLQGPHGVPASKTVVSIQILNGHQECTYTCKWKSTLYFET